MIRVGLPVLRLAALCLVAAPLPAAAERPPTSGATAPAPQVQPDAAGTAAAKHKPKPTPVIQAPAGTHAKHPVAPIKPAAPEPVAPPEATKPPETKGSATGLPVPRWAALRSDEVNLRVGPGMRFPIQWQYHRRDLPVQILRESDLWRLIQDQDGIKGWVHKATLVGHRGFVVKTTEVVMRRSADEGAAPVARLKPGVVGLLRSCAADAGWCEVQVGDYSGWLRRDDFYGTDPGEAVGG